MAMGTLTRIDGAPTRVETPDGRVASTVATPVAGRGWVRVDGEATDRVFRHWQVAVPRTLGHFAAGDRVTVRLVNGQIVEVDGPYPRSHSPQQVAPSQSLAPQAAGVLRLGGEKPQTMAEVSAEERMARAKGARNITRMNTRPTRVSPPTNPLTADWAID